MEKNFKTNTEKNELIDEYQDISRGRYRLIKALINNQKDCRLMCVWGMIGNPYTHLIQ